MMLNLKVPTYSCRECPYLKTKVIDHNYYGEKTKTTTCTIFNVPIKGCTPCDACIVNRVENQEDIRKYADFLVKEINKMASETHNRTLDELLVKAVDLVKYTDETTPVIHFKDLKDLIDSLREE